MVVRSIDLVDGQGQVRGVKKVVFIGKPFPAKTVTALDKNRLAFKAAAGFILHGWEEDKPADTQVSSSVADPDPVGSEPFLSDPIISLGSGSGSNDKMS